MSLFAVAVIGTWQLGAFPLGWAADHVGAATALAGSCVLGAALVAGLALVARPRIGLLQN